MATEKLKFKLKLYAIMWDSFPETIGTLATRRRGGKPPVAEITVGGKSYFKGDITAYEKEPALIEFEAELTEGQDYELVIHRSGKDKGETIVNDKGGIVCDQHQGYLGPGGSRVSYSHKGATNRFRPINNELYIADR